MPNPDEFPSKLLQMHPAVAAAVLVAGVIYLILGWKWYKYLVVVNAAVIGAAAGWWGGSHLNNPNMPWIGAGAGALLLGVATWPLMKWSVSLMGALAGLVIGYYAWHYAAQTADNPADFTGLSWVGALIGLITMGLLAFIIFKVVVIIFTSFEGAGMIISGGTALLMKNEGMAASIQDNLTQNIYLLPLMVVVPTVIGAIIQQTNLKGGSGKPATAKASK